MQGVRRCAGSPAFAALQGSGVEAVLEPGDTLLLPAYWWHHVHAFDDESLSVSFWMARGQSLSAAVKTALSQSGPDPAQSEVRVGQHEPGHDSPPHSAAHARCVQRASGDDATGGGGGGGGRGEGNEGGAAGGVAHGVGVGWDASVCREFRLRLAREVETAVAVLLGPASVRGCLLRLHQRLWEERTAARKRAAGEGREEGRQDGWEDGWEEDLDGGVDAAEEEDRSDEYVSPLEAKVHGWLIERLRGLLGHDAAARFVLRYLGRRRLRGLL